MAIQLPQGFKIGSVEPIDTRLVLTKEEMLSIKDSVMPDRYFAVCKDDSKLYVYNKNNLEDPETGKFRVYNQGGGGGSGELENDLIVSNPLGRYKIDDVISAGTEFEDIFRGLLSKTYYPTLTDPSASINYGAPTLAKVGSNISAMTATVGFNRGSINPQYSSDSPYRSGEATSYRVNLSGSSTSYDETKTTTQFSVPSFTRTSKGNVTVTATVSYSAGVQPKDSDGNNYQSPLPAGSKSTTKTIEFILPFYYGASNTFDVSDLTGLNEDLSKKGNKTYKITTDNQYLTIIYDSSYGDLKSILDSNNFELIDGWTKTTKTIGGQSYNIWVANEATTDTNAQFTFKF